MKASSDAAAQTAAPGAGPGALSTAAQFWRFAIIGTIGFVADSLALMVALKLLYLGLYGGRVVSYLVAATCTWALNRRFTFRHASDEAAIVQWLRFLGANAIGGAVNYGTYAALVTFLPVVAANPVLGVAAGSIAGLAFNFTINKFWVFRPRT
jgi:putative flippase GtrA